MIKLKFRHVIHVEFVNSFLLLLLFSLCSCVTSFRDNSGKKVDKLWYQQPAEKWIESLPVGNGRLGAVVYGGITQEMLGLNLSTLWSGEPPKNSVKPTALENLSRVRQLYFDRKPDEAVQLIKEHLLGNQENYGTHLPMGNLLINFDLDEEKVSNYQRQLNIENAQASVCFQFNGIQYKREILTSHPDDVLLVRFTADKGKPISATIRFKSEGIPLGTEKVSERIWGIEGDAFEKKHSDGKTGVHFFTGIEVHQCDGKFAVTDSCIELENAGNIELRICGYTSYKKENPRERTLAQFLSIGSLSYNDIRRSHVEDYQALYKKASLSLGNDTIQLPTDERIKRLSSADSDPQLYALFYNYARYLLIAGSRADSPLPTNLQGIWNDNFACNMPWTCDFHLDINTQQNYWLTESGNLSECHQPLFNLIEGLADKGKKTAGELYGCDGWVAHVVTNAWGYTAPGWGMGWSHHVTGGIWIASHLWNHYEYTLDTDFLKETAYPVLKQAAVFFDQYLVKNPAKGWLVSGPSLSPENKYLDETGKRYSETMGPTCDAVLIRDLFNSCIKASEILDTDKEFRNKLKEEVALLPPLMIGKYGQLQEWLEDYEEAIPNHRHTSHLIALYPSCQIDPHRTPELAKATEVTLSRRLAQPDWEDVEWSRGNFINFYARLLEPEEALKHLHGLLKDNTSISMLAYSRGGIAGAPQDIFSIDGNFAGASGISEMLVQSYDDEIYILPALPKSWKVGEFRGVCTRNGFILNLSWDDGELKKLEVFSGNGEKCSLNYRSKQVSFNTHPGMCQVFDASFSL